MTASIITPYYALFLMIVGTILNVLTFIVLCRPSFKETKKQPIIHYMRTIVIFDILMLYGWNLEHYLKGVYGFTLERYSISSCEFFLFLSYFTAQSSAWLRIFVCINRYLSLSRLHKTCFSHSKHVIIIIVCIISFLVLLNLHIVIFACFYTSNGIIDINSRLYTIFPMWNYVNLAVYSFISLVLMILFNGGAIYHLIRLHRTTTIDNSRIHHRSISITLFTITFLSLIMTLPAIILFTFLQTILRPSILSLTDGLLYTYHITSFSVHMITFKEFRQECIVMITCKKNLTRIAPIQTHPVLATIKLKTTT